MSLLSTTNKAYLNRWFGRMAYKLQLGDIIEDALQVAAGELTAVGDGKILVGAATTGIATAVTAAGDVTISNAGATAIGGDKVLNAMIADDQIDSEHYVAGSIDTEHIAADQITGALIADDQIDSEHLVAGCIDAEHLSAGAIASVAIADDSLRLGDIGQSQMVMDFSTMACFFSGAGALGAAVDTDNAVNAIHCRNRYLQYHNIGIQTLGVNWVAGSGLNIAGDETNNEGLEVNCGDTTSEVSKVVDTDNFYFRAKVKIQDVSGVQDLAIGLRKAQAHEDAYTSYTDFYCVGCNASADPMDLDMISDLNGADAVSTDTASNLADTEYVDVKIWVGDEARLQSAIVLMAAVKSAVNTHFADATEHIQGQQTALAAVAPTTTATLITAVTEALAAFAVHSDDANEVSPSTYHDAQSAGDDSLASEVAPTTLAECVTRLNDIRAKFDLHAARGAAAPHADGDSGVVDAGTPPAANMHCLIGVNGALAVPNPAAAVAFNFDAGDTVLPFIHLINHTDTSGYVYLSNFEVVDVTTT